MNTCPLCSVTWFLVIPLRLKYFFRHTWLPCIYQAQYFMYNWCLWNTLMSWIKETKKKKKGTQWIISESPTSLKVGIKAHKSLWPHSASVRYDTCRVLAEEAPRDDLLNSLIQAGRQMGGWRRAVSHSLTYCCWDGLESEPSFDCSAFLFRSPWQLIKVNPFLKLWHPPPVTFLPSLFHSTSILLFVFFLILFLNFTILY